jgi:hypothetical protein
MKTKLFAMLSALFFAGCAQTTLYRDGKPVARFAGDMTGMTFKSGADGSFEWTGDVDHSTPTRAYGEASQSRIAAAAGIAAYGLSKLP